MQGLWSVAAYVLGSLFAYVVGALMLEQLRGARIRKLSDLIRAVLAPFRLIKAFAPLALWLSVALAKRFTAGLFMHRRLVAAELMTRGFSRALPHLRMAKWKNKMVPVSSFCYDPQSLRPEHSRVHKGRVVNDCNASNGTSILFEDPDTEWAVFGPYIRLPKRGHYLAVFRVRLCRRRGYHISDARRQLEFDVAHLESGENRPTFHCASRRWSGFDKQYASVAISFAYNGEKDVEFRVRPRQQAKHPPVPRVAIDCISVVYVGRKPRLSGVASEYQEGASQAQKASEPDRLPFPETFAGEWQLVYGTQQDRETVSIRRNGEYWCRNRLAFTLDVEDYRPRDHILWRKVESSGKVRSREVLTIMSEDELEGYGHDNPDHRLHYVRRSS